MTSNEKTGHSHAPIAGLITPSGRGAVAAVRVQGDAGLIDQIIPEFFQANNGRSLSEQSIGRIVYGQWGSHSARLGDGRDALSAAVSSHQRNGEQVVFCRINSNVVEIHCHGGRAAVCRILDDLASVGCEVQSWSKMLEQTNSQFEAELVETLSRAKTQRTANLLLRQQTGLLRSAVENMQRDVEEVDLAQPIDWQAKAILSQIDGLLNWADFGQHLTQPWDVVVAGRPNVGKSSLINVLLGYARSIVYDQPGTTRDAVIGETVFDGWPFRLTDTAGIRDESEPLESEGIERTRQRLADADCRLILVDISQAPTPHDERLLHDWPDALRMAHKSDLKNIWGDRLPSAALRVSSLTGEGVEQLVEQLVSELIPSVPPVDTPFPVTQRQVQLLRTAHKAVRCEDWDGCSGSLQELLS